MDTSCRVSVQQPPGRLPVRRGVLPGRPAGWAGQVVRTVQACLPAAPESVPKARTLTGLQFCTWGLPGLAEDAVLVVSELTTNAVTAARRAGSGDVVVRLALAPGAVRVAVANRAGRWRLATALSLGRLTRLPPGALAESGRGLAIATAASQRIGWYAVRGWTIVWAELDIPGRAARADLMASPQPARPVPHPDDTLRSADRRHG